MFVCFILFKAEILEICSQVAVRFCVYFGSLVGNKDREPTTPEVSNQQGQRQEWKPRGEPRASTWSEEPFSAIPS